VTAQRRRALWPAGAVALAVLGLAGAANPLPRAAEQAPLAARGLLLAVATAGERLVAVGDRGVIVLSDDGGSTWRQAAAVPVQALLTGVCFGDARHGVAVGHDEVILTTADGGEHWQLVHFAPDAQRPLLDVWCGDHAQVIAVGAYSAYLVSADAGASWNALRFAPLAAQPGPRHRADEETRNDYHLNRIVSAGALRLFIAAEAGHLYRSDDGGASWISLSSPYQGSFFGVLPLGPDVVLAFGLRGNLYRSEDGGTSWQHVDTGTVAMLDGGARLADTAAVIVGLSGVVLSSQDAGRSFTLRQQPDHSGLAAVLPLGDGVLAAVGESGAQRIALAPPAGGR
jgi:photosystem II stability/assembly factor-like uncharacterized protein